MTFEEQKELDRKTANDLVDDAAESLQRARELYKKIGDDDGFRYTRDALTTLWPITGD